MQSELLKNIWTDKVSATEIYTVDINRISRTEYDAAYSVMSRERKNKCDGLRFESDKKLCIAADMMLRKVISEKTGIAAESLAFFADENGKPYLEDNGYHFSISHSGDIAAVAVNKENSVGIDVEKIKPVSAGVAKRIFSERDICFVFGSNMIPEEKIEESETLTRFFKVWTYKEAFVKMTGEGITDSIKDYSYNENNCITKIFDGYVLTVITKTE